MIEIIRLDTNNFNEKSLDNFKREQKVTECWRFIGNGYKLVPVEYTEDWDRRQLRELALRIYNGLNEGCIAYGAVTDGNIVGFAYIENKLFGSKNQYVDLAEFYVSAPFRRRNIGRLLFNASCAGAKALGAKKLYISAHSAKESIAAYKSYGCTFADEINAEFAEKEPYDLQLEFCLEN